MTISIPHARVVNTKPIRLTVAKGNGWLLIFVLSLLLWTGVLMAGVFLLADRISAVEIRTHKNETYRNNNEQAWDNHYKKTHKIHVKKDEWEK